jgi:catechol 2,3-dioxygenase-like lactoylglutathione lyase family enzyme
MIRVKEFHHVAIVVKDLKRSKAFYEGILSLYPIPRPDFGFPGEWYEVGHQQLHLMEGQDVLNQKQHFAIEVGNIKETFETLKSNAVTIVSPPDKRPHDRSDYMFCLDPDGNLIELTHHG